MGLLHYRRHIKNFCSTGNAG